MALITVSGHLLDASGTAQVGALVAFELVNLNGNLPYVSGTNIVVTTKVSVTTTAGGAFTAQIQGNDTITPSGTFYKVTFNANQVSYYLFTGAGPYNLDSTAPLTTLPIPIGPPPSNILNGNNTFTGTNSFSKPVTFTGSPAISTGGEIDADNIYLTPTQADAAKLAGVVNVQVPSGGGQISGISSQIVGFYSSMNTDSVRTLAWGQNPIANVPAGQSSGWSIWGSESDVNVLATTAGQAIGYAAVSGTGGTYFPTTITSAVTRPTWAFVGEASLTGSQPFNVCYACDNPGFVAYGFMSQDSGLEITQAITANASAQTVTTNAVNGTNRLSVGSYISVDTGASQEDVKVLSLFNAGATNVGQNFSISAIFTKNHSSNVSFFQYASDYLWNASYPGNIASRISTYLVGDLRAYTNASNPLRWSITDTTGAEGLYSAILSSPAGLQVYRSLQNAGWQWQDESAAVKMTLSHTGVLGIPNINMTGTSGALTFYNGATDTIKLDMEGGVLVIRDDTGGDHWYSAFSAHEHVSMFGGSANDSSALLELINGSVVIDAGELKLASGHLVTWNADTGLSRISAGLIGIGNGTQGDFSGAIKTTSPIINGTPSGTGIPTVTLKSGTGAGNYTTTSSTFANIDGTNLLYTINVPVGWKLIITASFKLQASVSSDNPEARLFDTQGSVVLDLVNVGIAAANTPLREVLESVITGDGNSHTVSLQLASADNTNTAVILNTSAASVPRMIFTLTPSN